METVDPLLLLWFARDRHRPGLDLLEFQVLETEITRTRISHKFMSTMKIRFFGKLR